ncbi:hypothetical protein [uncultured Tenacibaculum sp.]|uniref:hypothetical protein n=1 Tax=uncultured Tenacibaculum sp. TaxID=174713 RepID=UPI00262ADA1F|nr:hypothetical protein [uncultured Tenacibaculum sp.]
MKWGKKINAGALQYVLVIAVIILIILFAFIQLINLQQKTNLKKTLYQKAVLNANNSFKFIEAKSVGNNKDFKINFLENSNEEVILKKSYWGIFDLINITSIVNKEKVNKIGLIGNKIEQKKAIYLTDNNTPLVLVGNSKIQGEVYLPFRGVKSGNIAGNSFYGGQLIQGVIKRSSSNLPKNDRIQSIEKRLEGLLNNEENFELKEDLKVIRSFNEKPLHYRAEGTLVLQKVLLKGNIIISSQKKIIVTKETTLEDIVIIAPEIEIATGVKGSFQAFAADKINVGSNVDLYYPSALVVNLKKEKLENNNGLFVNNNTSIKGTLIFLKQEKESLNYFPQLILGEYTKITGEVFCKGNTELKGSVTGELYTDGFIAIQAGSKYVNHIYNGNVNANDLHNQYVGLGVVSKEKGVAKWLY